MMRVFFVKCFGVLGMLDEKSKKKLISFCSENPNLLNSRNVSLLKSTMKTPWVFPNSESGLDLESARQIHMKLTEAGLFSELWIKHKESGMEEVFINERQGQRRNDKTDAKERGSMENSLNQQKKERSRGRRKTDK